jgi:hypothetical protein
MVHSMFLIKWQKKDIFSLISINFQKNYYESRLQGGAIRF